MRLGARHISNYTTVRWGCIHFESVQAVKELRHRLIDLHLQVFEIDAVGIESDEGLFSRISTTMRFPFTVSNYDGLNDFLRDLNYEFQTEEVLAPGQPTGVLLIVRNARVFWSAAPVVAGSLVESWLFSAEYWSNVHVAFHLVFEM